MDGFPRGLCRSCASQASQTAVGLRQEPADGMRGALHSGPRLATRPQNRHEETHTVLRTSEEAARLSLGSQHGGKTTSPNRLQLQSDPHTDRCLAVHPTTHKSTARRRGPAGRGHPLIITGHR